MNLQTIISENPNISITINANDLAVFAQSIAETTARTILDGKKEKLFTRTEVRDLLHVSDATLWRWDKNGIVNGKKIGNRRYYTEADVNELLTSKTVK